MEQVQTTKQAEPKQLTVTIVCVDCGAERTVAVQDAKQVKRCVACQEKYRKVQRKEYRKNLIKGLRATIETQKALIDELRGQLLVAEALIDKK